MPLSFKFLLLLFLLASVLGSLNRVEECDEFCAMGDGYVNECCSRWAEQVIRGYCRNTVVWCLKPGREKRFYQ